ncbi:hypothetical protein BDV37DRAFT_251713 [Aspergillus pseudonomiae]|uniref:Uncharacterized protein n=1 Tax=Aspergillus pseudonomiae TaxID=1506151 RepID=A0A5N7D968_9EURO|nr:uncharacterized protein BDV37DRAFT_251713 [Aspergillus pseudonomiae]KAE8402854.1 hypothetical protein BDV37DRAFT_251713 [Aspergillus pseudonomiae]
MHFAQVANRSLITISRSWSIQVENTENKENIEIKVRADPSLSTYFNISSARIWTKYLYVSQGHEFCELKEFTKHMILPRHVVMTLTAQAKLHYLHEIEPSRLRPR